MKENIALQIPWTLMIIQEYYEQFFVYKFDELDEMKQFLERYNGIKHTGGIKKSEQIYIY